MANRENKLNGYNIESFTFEKCFFAISIFSFHVCFNKLLDVVFGEKYNMYYICINNIPSKYIHRY